MMDMKIYHFCKVKIMKTRIVFVDGMSLLGKTKIFDWPFDQLPEKDNTISKDLIPGEILWANYAEKDDNQSF